MHAGLARGSAKRLRARTIRGFARRWPISPRRVKKSAPPRPNSDRSFNLEGRARAGHDIDGFAGRTTDLQALGVLRWTLYNGGTKEANVREQQRRADEVHGRLFERTRSAEEDVAHGLEPPAEPDGAGNELEAQGRITDDVLLSYREQFNIGRRSLLDVLDAQNTRYNVQAQAQTAQLAKLYAQYRVLAARTGWSSASACRFRSRRAPIRWRASTSIRSRRRPDGRQHSGSGDGSARSGRRNACRRDSRRDDGQPDRRAVGPISTSEDGL